MAGVDGVDQVRLVLRRDQGDSALAHDGRAQRCSEGECLFEADSRGNSGRFLEARELAVVGREHCSLLPFGHLLAQVRVFGEEGEAVGVDEHWHLLAQDPGELSGGRLVGAGARAEHPGLHPSRILERLRDDDLRMCPHHLSGLRTGVAHHCRRGVYSTRHGE